MEHITEALISLAIIVIVLLGKLIKVWFDHLIVELGKNTTISAQARDASNGRLSEVIDRLAAARDQILGLRGLLRERDDRIAYIVARVPGADKLMQEYSDRRASHITAADELAAERHLMADKT